MKCFLALLFSASFPTHAVVCGLYQSEDFGGRVLYTITRFTSATPATQTLFTITNPETTTVKGMVRGLCYCARGTIQLDPDFEGDENYQLITIDQLEGPAYLDCMPDRQISSSFL